MFPSDPPTPVHDGHLIVSSAPTYSLRTPLARILIVEDHEVTQRILTQNLSGAGCAPLVAGRGAEALELFRTHPPDLVLLDLILPDIDGLAVCRAIRASSTVPILVLSALSEEAHQVALLDAGADDYLVKPVQREILLACIRRALARHRAAAPAGSLVYQFGSVLVDEERRQVWRAGRPVQLTPHEWALLLLLAHAQGRVVSYQYISAALWPGEPQYDAESPHTLAKQLRRKLGPDLGLTNVRRVGYCLHPTLEEA